MTTIIKYNDFYNLLTKSYRYFHSTLIRLQNSYLGLNHLEDYKMVNIKLWNQYYESKYNNKILNDALMLCIEYKRKLLMLFRSRKPKIGQFYFYFFAVGVITFK